MRPQAPHDPGIELSEKLSDAGSLVVLTPAPHNRIYLRNDLVGRQRDPSLRQLPDPILEPMDRLLARVGVQRSRRGTATQLAAPALVQFAETGLAIAVRVGLPVLLPKQLLSHV